MYRMTCVYLSGLSCAALNASTCSRINTGATPDVIGVSVRYTYQTQTPLAALINMLNIQMGDYTTFELNPTN